MSNPDTTKAETAVTTEKQAPAGGPDLWAPVFGGLESWSERCGLAISGHGRNWFEFANRRFKADVDLTARLSRSRKPDDVWRAYRDFYETAFDDYREEFAELARLNSDLASNAFDAIHQGMSNGAAARRATPKN